MKDVNKTENPYSPPSGIGTAKENESQVIAGLRNLAALAVTLGGAAFIMLAPWRCWINGFSDMWFELFFATAVGFVAAVVGKYNGAVWYIPWLLANGILDGINNPQGDRYFLEGMAICARLSFPMVPVGFITSFVKKSRTRRRLANAGSN
jgi:hypothetical protein